MHKDIKTGNYVNRDLSWVEFNRRVLQEAQDSTTPMLERMRFLGIVASNLDEFVSVRLAETKEKIKAGFTQKDFTGYTPPGLYRRLIKRTGTMVAEQYKTYRELVRLLAKKGVHIQEYVDLNVTQQRAMDQYYHDIIFPVLTPMAIDQSRPFPLVHNKSVYLSVMLQKEDELDGEPFMAIVQVPSNLPRIVKVPLRANSKKKTFILIEDLIKQHVHTLFSGYVSLAVQEFRVTRNADLSINEEEAEDLLEAIEKELRRRRRGAPVRLEVCKDFRSDALQELQEEFEIQDPIFEIDGPLDLSFLSGFVDSLDGFSHLKYGAVQPVYPPEFVPRESHFELLRKRDVLVHHPYESFEPVTDFILEASEDPQVLAIKMTLYRVNGDSRLIPALALAAESGKQVTVVVELKARFDEERNIAWARKLEKAGCHVVYGLVGLKTHAKIILVVRREQQGLRRYVHVGTGNYNESTAKVYTDVGLFTANPIIGEDASELFNEITGYSGPKALQAFRVAPDGMKDELFSLIQRETEHALKGKRARIIAKINSLSHQEIIDQLYAASQAGVQIDLIVRGVCCLRPGIEGLSENIRVISIVDRFLEHSRLFYFENDGNPDVFISSADWMSRNLNRRIELMCPVFDPTLKKMLVDILNLSLNDNVKARQLMPNGNYVFVKNEKPPLRSQTEAMGIIPWKPAEWSVLT
ncbi:polyphosphate kinase 1 [Paenibacillus barcinonensis]|uniref:Polyphosphate kinase n=1 Tax=Paenibacillus barcinonensis TaxID=198119 RepID=A0A2V4VH97_PAEBA|nr:polyphosphate kinase 1 [Paenibacillus barcinonensis]PYE48208.1 polyphosphate kinase [Paenibacillus barcinonensis]QKS56940.1 polyphosphate kinase 1 [Paenibacillus barcinonensis]